MRSALVGIIGSASKTNRQYSATVTDQLVRCTRPRLYLLNRLHLGGRVQVIGQFFKTGPRTFSRPRERSGLWARITASLCTLRRVPSTCPLNDGRNEAECHGVMSHHMSSRVPSANRSLVQVHSCIPRGSTTFITPPPQVRPMTKSF